MGTRVLIIEDNPINLEPATDSLEAAGYSVTQAQSAEEGVERARNERPGLILRDMEGGS